MFYKIKYLLLTPKQKLKKIKPSMEFDFNTLIVFGLISLFAAFIHGSIGLGFPLVATPLLALFNDIQSAIILTLVPAFFTNLTSIKSEGNILPAFRRYVLIALFVMAGSAIGTQLLILTNTPIFKALLAVAIFMYLFVEKTDLNLTWVSRNRRLSQFVFGTSAGILGGLTNVMAPVLIVYTLESRHSKSETIQLLNFCFLFGKITQIVLFAGNGKFTLGQLSASSIMLLSASLALYFGIKVRKKIELAVYRKILKLVLLLLAALLLYQFSRIAL